VREIVDQTLGGAGSRIYGEHVMIYDGDIRKSRLNSERIEAILKPEGFLLKDRRFLVECLCPRL
jgi:hypothetical protein